MALFGLISKCVNCGGYNLSSNLNANGLCDDCATKRHLEMLKKASHVQTRTKNTASTSVSHSDPLDTAVRYSFHACNVHNNCAMAYRYLNISVSHVDRNLLRNMVTAKEYSVDLSAMDSGEVQLLKDGKAVAKLEDKVEMCIDWIKKKRPLLCEFSGFGNGKEKVALFFYRAETEEMADNRCEIIKLTSCMSEDKQESIAFLEPGEKLFVELDDNDKPYIRDISYNPIGKLPAKYNRLYEDDLICGIYFDHAETLISKDIAKEDKEIPYVRVYISES